MNRHLVKYIVDYFLTNEIEKFVVQNMLVKNSVQLSTFKI